MIYKRLSPNTAYLVDFPVLEVVRVLPCLEQLLLHLLAELALELDATLVAEVMAHLRDDFGKVLLRLREAHHVQRVQQRLQVELGLVPQLVELPPVEPHLLVLLVRQKALRDLHVLAPPPDPHDVISVHERHYVLQELVQRVVRVTHDQDLA